MPAPANPITFKNLSFTPTGASFTGFKTILIHSTVRTDNDNDLAKARNLRLHRPVSSAAQKADHEIIITRIKADNTGGSLKIQELGNDTTAKRYQFGPPTTSQVIKNPSQTATVIEQILHAKREAAQPREAQDDGSKKECQPFELGGLTFKPIDSSSHFEDFENSLQSYTLVTRTGKRLDTNANELVTQNRKPNLIINVYPELENKRGIYTFTIGVRISGAKEVAMKYTVSTDDLFPHTRDKPNAINQIVKSIRALNNLKGKR